jgi:hypothetical protein
MTSESRKIECILFIMGFDEVKKPALKCLRAHIYIRATFLTLGPLLLYVHHHAKVTETTPDHDSHNPTVKFYKGQSFLIGAWPQSWDQGEANNHHERIVPQTIMKRWQQQEWIGWDEARIWEGSTALFRKLNPFWDVSARSRLPTKAQRALLRTLDISTKGILSKEGMSSSHPGGPAEYSET